MSIHASSSHSEIYSYTVGIDASGNPYYNDAMAPTSVETNKRGDFKFHKVDEDGNSLANVKFELTNIRTNESVIIWTDEDGYYSSESSFILHSKNTNSGDAGDGIWFGNINDLDDNLGALTADTYRLQELLCDANKNTYKYDKIDFTFDVDTHGQVVDLGDIVNEYNVIITTSAKDSVTNAQIVALGDTIDIIDTVHLQKLEVGHTYHLKFKIWSKRDNNFLKDDAGVDIEETHTFVATDTTMDVDMITSITVDESFLGQDIVCFEYCTDDDYPGEEFNHADEDFASQTLYFAKIGTQAKDDVTMEHIGCVSTDATIIDTIKYENLVPNLRYDIVAKLVYLESGEPVIQDGKEYVIKVNDFIPTTEDGTYDVNLSHINAEALQGKTVTVQEYIYFNDNLVAKHDELVEEQSIHYPTGGTTAKDSVTGTNDFLASKEQKFIDVCTYENLIPGEEYSVEGVLMTKTVDGKATPLLDKDGKEITGKTVFTPTKPNGEVEVVFTFDGSLLAGEVVTCFETYYYKNREIFAHRDINDKQQTLLSPKITTKARDSVNLTHYGEKSEDAKITDKIIYTNTIKGEKYEIVGWLMDKKTNSPVLDADGNQIKVTKEFIAGENGEIEIEYSIDVTMFITKDKQGNDVIDKDVVVFEEMYHVYADGTKKLVAEEKDIENAEQTVYYKSQPKTSDKNPIVFLFGVVLVSGAGLVLLKRRKKQL